MPFRNLSPNDMFFQMALAHTPKYQFNPESGKSFKDWKKDALPEVLATLGKWPDKVDLCPELTVEWQHDGLTKQRWIIDVGPFISAVFQINYPQGLKKGEKRPTLLCWHGHGEYGKESVMGNNSTPERQSEIARLNYNYGHEMAKKGFVTFAIDWIGIGERSDKQKPHYKTHNWGRDWCNLYYLHATMLGYTSLSINLAHGQAATDFALTLPHTDPERLGVMGLSGGGTMTLWTALTDSRFKAAQIMGYSDQWAYFGFRDLNYCGMQIAPGLYDLVDLPDLQGLLAPKPLLMDIGVHDTCFIIENAIASFRKLEKIYAAAGAQDKLELEIHPGEHSWGGNLSEEFFRKNL